MVVKKYKILVQKQGSKKLACNLALDQTKAGRPVRRQPPSKCHHPNLNDEKGQSEANPMQYVVKVNFRKLGGNSLYLSLINK